eukprot:CAMPEP_0174577904 /NCGR_PEP_ID=MMETSP0929-20130131/321_1 /TAXON_ID=548131 ORGANISM="Ostreococcus mediterraneus, Strain clade-D-RCC2572" /NCGR_SAMPLE_ID=MMETSP0929 /ASSEMBLY_ACC=CAM_ASM_000573 /LENGTH=137 /DNA_ID=CAMNT_0015758815 /DNA_START=197 /DNA_END=610 /DNA_ORIENTATION=-
MCVLTVQSDVGYATHVSTKPLPIWSSSRKDWSDWSMEPATTLPAQDEHAPARQEYGRSMPASSAASRMYVSSAHSITVLPSGPSRVTEYLALIAARGAAVRRATVDVRAAENAEAVTAVEEIVKADIVCAWYTCVRV